MDREAMDALHYDRRLSHRRDWIKPEELAQAETDAADASEKATTLGAAADAAEAHAEAAAAAPPAAQPVASPTPPTTPESSGF